MGIAMMKEKIEAAHSRAGIFGVADKSPLVHGALMYWRMGELTWEQSLELAVTLLFQENERLTAELVRLHENSEYRLD